MHKNCTVNTQTGSVSVAGSQSNTVNTVKPVIMESSKPECATEGRGGVEYIFSSMRRRGNRNKALLLREKREKLKEKRSTGYKRCGMVSSKQVPEELVQDKSRTIVVIGSDAVSLFPSLTK